ncbi:MAG: TrmH family RNA methyltransferase [Candidatus Cloacimonadota bacterium]|nr:MAG: TrmH family RNA methyltransferase [Candidatus Cloacimonadota bacterium]
MWLDDNKRETYLKFVTDKRLYRMIDVIDTRTNYISLVLENLYQPHNASAVIRSAEALGIQTINVIEYENKFTPSLKITNGTEKWISINRYKTVEECFQSLRESGYRILYADPNEENHYLDEIDLDKKIALVFGEEKPGLTEKAKKLADAGFRIPMFGFVQSFNISVAAGISLFTLRTQLEKSVGKSIFLSDEEKAHLLEEWMIKYTPYGMYILSTTNHQSSTKES